MVVGISLPRYALAVALVVATASACGGSSKAANVTVSAACSASMKASAQIGDDPSATDAQDLASTSATLRACHSRAEWLQAVVPYTSSGVNTCVVCGNAKPSVVLAGFCTGEDANAPACT